MHTHSIFHSLLAGALLLGTLSGCASTGETATERDFGNSVRHMTQMQTLNPLPTPPSASPTIDGDGERVDNVLKAYRDDVAQPDDVSQDIVINLGNQ